MLPIFRFLWHLCAKNAVHNFLKWLVIMSLPVTSRLGDYAQCYRGKKLRVDGRVLPNIWKVFQILSNWAKSPTAVWNNLCGLVARPVSDPWCARECHVISWGLAAPSLGTLALSCTQCKKKSLQKAEFFKPSYTFLTAKGIGTDDITYFRRK